MQLTLSIFTILFVLVVSCALLYFLMSKRIRDALTLGKTKEEELSRKVYEIAILKEIGERIGYSPDAAKVIAIISSSLEGLLPFSTVSHMVSGEEGSINLEIHVNEPVSHNFVGDVKTKMIAAYSAMTGQSVVDGDIDFSVSGKILDETQTATVQSFFNLPIIISGRVMGLINVASYQKDIYKEEETDMLYRISKQASDSASRLNEVLENEKGRLVQAVEALSDGLMMVNTNYQLILANKKLREFLHLVENPKIFDVTNALSGKFDLRSKVEEVISNPDPLPTEEIVLGNKFFQVMASRVWDSKRQKAVGVVVLFHDATDSKSLEKLRQDFTAMMVHELRSPLTSIKSTVELLKGDLNKATKEELLGYLTQIDSTAFTMLELVGDLLDVAKMESGKFDVICDGGDLAPLILERVETYKPLALAKNIKLTVDVADKLPEAWFDKIRMKQVLNNLLSNALKFTETGEIKVKAVGEMVNGITIDILVSVTDTGIGIDEDSTGKLFSRFGQLEDGRRKAAGRSSGLGLFIAKGIVEASGGKIWVDSAGVGMGSTFYFTVPLAAKDDKIKGEEKKANAPLTFSTSKVGRA